MLFVKRKFIGLLVIIIEVILIYEFIVVNGIIFLFNIVINMLLNIFLVRKCFDLGLECDVDFFNKL